MKLDSRIQTQLCHLATVWPWTSYLTPLGSSFLICPLEMVTVPVLQGLSGLNKVTRISKTQSTMPEAKNGSFLDQFGAQFIHEFPIALHIMIMKYNRCRGWIDAKLLWKCHSVTRVEKLDMILQMKKLRPSEICCLFRPPCPPSLPASLGSCWVTSEPAGQREALWGRSLLSAA